ncbi:hypothetical protein FIBSPDRAFT_869287 [Athelia psychrophila]|uniref:Uncharacterized protein n=1 Tax=Athelia psychrophila TaxID=1759441 RepID=A0A166CAU1_9AGAM|nr:hypothetical protein FIBSPDRAFT_869287 [Fibularhizoctonia sp. CBS 109695]
MVFTLIGNHAPPIPEQNSLHGAVQLPVCGCNPPCNHDPPLPEKNPPRGAAQLPVHGARHP